MKFFNSIVAKLIIALLVLFVLINQSFFNLNKDFTVFVKASALVFEGKSCYDVWIHSGSSGLKYYYSPLFAILLAPIKDLPQGVGNFIWLSLNLMLFIRLLKLVDYFLNIKPQTDSKKTLFFLLLIVSSSRFIFDCLSQGQMTFILVWGTIESVALIHKRQLVKGSLLLALVINFKILPIAILAYLVYKRETKASLLTIIFSFVFLLAPALVIGFDFNLQLLQDWYKSITSTNNNSLMEDYGRQSLSSFLPALLMETPQQFGIKRNLFSLHIQDVDLILNSARIFLLIACALLFGKPFKPNNNKLTIFYEISFICALTPIFFPHQGKYSFLYLLPANAYCLSILLNRNEFYKINSQTLKLQLSIGFLIASFILGILTTDGIVGRKIADLCEYLCCITLSTFALLIATLLLKPSKSYFILQSTKHSP